MENRKRRKEEKKGKDGSRLKRGWRGDGIREEMGG